MTAALETEAKEGMGAKGTGEPNRGCVGDREGDPVRPGRSPLKMGLDGDFKPGLARAER